MSPSGKRSALAALLLGVSFLAAGHATWLQRRIVVSADIKFAAPSVCQVFYTESDDEGLRFGRCASSTVAPGGSRVEFDLPVANLSRLRVDFGTRPGRVRAGPVRVSGEETRTLDWRDFGIRHDIGKFDIDAKGAVDVGSTGGDPYAVRAEPLGVRGGLRVNFFSAFCLLLFAAFAWWPLAGPHGVLRAPFRRDGEPFWTPPLLLLAAVLVAARTALTAEIPPWFVQYEWDDLWFAKAGLSLAEGSWLGPYDDHTLAKGAFGPMVLAACRIAGVPFLFAETALYAAGCLFFVHVVSKLSRNRLLAAGALFFLLFNPVSFAAFTWQRIYRNGMALWQVPLVFGCFFLAYRSCGGPVRRWLPWTLCSGIALWAFQNTREDGLWIWPFVLAASVLSALRARAAGATRRRRIARAALCFLPLALFALGNAALCAVDWRAYGRPVRNDRNSGNYAKAMSDLYLVAPDPDDERRLFGPEHAGHFHNIPYSTLCKAYAASPTLASAREEIDSCIDAWGRNPKYHGRDLFWDHMLFAVRLGAAKAGRYATARDAEAFFGAVHRELSEAFAEGRLPRRGFSVGAMAAPFRAAHVLPFLREWLRAVSTVVLFRERIEPEFRTPEGSPDRPGCTPAAVPLFERASGGKTARPGRDPSRAAVGRARAAAAAYAAVAPLAVLAALAAAAVAAFLHFSGLRKASGSADGRLFAAAILASLFAHTACIGWVSATTFPSTAYFYLAPSYQLALMFAVVVAALCFSGSGRKERRRKQP